MAKTETKKTKPPVGGDTVVEITLKSAMAMLMHNGQLSDPENHHAIQISRFAKKKNKDTSDRHSMAHAEFIGGLWLDIDGAPCIPLDALHAMLHGGAKLRKKGKDFLSAVFVETDGELIYDGPRDPEALWADERFRDRRRVVIQRSANWRTRPIFKEWSCKFTVRILAGAGVGIEDLKEAVEQAGLRVGLGDYRPRFGRFVVQAFKVLKE